MYGKKHTLDFGIGNIMGEKMYSLEAI